jgi:hypothetical protein
MFKYISKILAQFSTPQKIVALSMLLLAIVIITIAPSLISSITLDRDELDSEIKKQDLKIEKLESDVDSLESSIRRNEKECTNQIVFREEEFLQMLDQLKGDIRSNNKNTEERIVRLNTISTGKKIYPVGDSSVSMMLVQEAPREEKVIVYKKPQISSTISMIDEMKKKIKKN